MQLSFVAPVLLAAVIMSLPLAEGDKFSWQRQQEIDPKVTDRVFCKTTKGNLEFEIFRDWAPKGAQRFMELVNDGFYSDIAMYRSVPDFLQQWGISDQPNKQHWHGNQIIDDPNIGIPLRHGYLSFAGGGPNTRSTQVFVTYKDVEFLGEQPWETPFGRVVMNGGAETLSRIDSSYGDIKPFGAGPDQQRIFTEGNDYVRKNFPNVDFIKACEVLTDTVTFSAEHRELTEAPEDVLLAASDIHDVAQKTTEQMNKAVQAAEDAKKTFKGIFDSLSSIMEIGEDEEARRARGEEVVEVLSPDELKRYYEERHKSHGPDELPPGQALILLAFGLMVAGVWSWTKRNEGYGLIDSKKA